MTLIIEPHCQPCFCAVQEFAVLHCYDLSTQAELREAAEARDACKEALELAQQGLADLEAALARESAAGEDCAKRV